MELSIFLAGVFIIISVILYLKYKKKPSSPIAGGGDNNDLPTDKEPGKGNQYQ